MRQTRSSNKQFSLNNQQLKHMPLKKIPARRCYFLRYGFIAGSAFAFCGGRRRSASAAPRIFGQRGGCSFSCFHAGWRTEFSRACLVRCHGCHGVEHSADRGRNRCGWRRRPVAARVRAVRGLGSRRVVCPPKLPRLKSMVDRPCFRFPRTGCRSICWTIRTRWSA